MKALSFSLVACLIATTVFAQQSDEQAVRKLLSTQSQAWNKGNIDEFMKEYWESDSLMFIGKSGITYGYKNTLNNYKKNYSNADLMGKLAFTLISVKRLSPEYYYVVGKWQLARKAGDVSGYFNLLFRKMNGKWVIIADHSS
jgi:ketosteroid isomerase-like protein